MNHEFILQNIKEEKQELIIFGAGNIGEMMASFCEIYELKVTCFCDNDQKKSGTFINDIPIHSLNDVKMAYKNPIFIISPIDEPIIDAIREQLKQQAFSLFYTAKEWTQCVTEKYKYPKTKSIMEKNNFEKEQLSVTFIDFSITEKCSLKCEQCAHLMQYYEAPKHADTKMLLHSLDRLDEVFDSILELHILGGESLTHPDFFDIVAYAQQKETIKSVYIVTNATILPDKDQLNALDKSKLFFSISDYGVHSKNIEELCQLLTTLGIEYQRTPMKEWLICAIMPHQNRMPDELQTMYALCLVRHCLMFIEGKLFHCAFLGNVHRLQAIPKNDIEYVDLLLETNTREQTRQEVKQYLYGNTYFRGCNYCQGRTVTEISPIPAAVQTKTPLPYKKYD